MELSSTFSLNRKLKLHIGLAHIFVIRHDPVRKLFYIPNTVNKAFFLDLINDIYTYIYMSPSLCVII